MKFQYTQMPHWPPLAWLAECVPGTEIVHVRYGNRIETREQWFCEAVWDGNFTEGGFDRTDIINGSGGRIREDQLCFVSSGSNIDRLHSLKYDGITLVSNSLICLMSWVGGNADPEYVAYESDFATYRYSIFGNHATTFPSSAGAVHLTYFRNLVWNGHNCSGVEKPLANRVFETFNDYRKFLSDAMHKVTANAAHPARVDPLKLLCPISTGYDSPTISVLAREATAHVNAFTFAQDREGRNDSGADIAKRLGIPCQLIERDAYRQWSLPEVPFVACSGSVGDLAFKSAEPLLAGTLFLSGAGGDSIWPSTRAEDLTQYPIGDGMMLGFTEYRLWAGFIHAPVPLWGIRSLNDIMRIGTSPEMRTWIIQGSYNRPICRRIVEEAGIPREAFGTQKKGVSVVGASRHDTLTPKSMQDLLDWLEECRNQTNHYWSRLPSPVMARVLDEVVSPMARLDNTVRQGRLRDFKPLRMMTWRLSSKFNQPYYHHRYRVHWAVERAKKRYSNAN